MSDNIRKRTFSTPNYSNCKYCHKQHSVYDPCVGQKIVDGLDSHAELEPGKEEYKSYSERLRDGFEMIGGSG